MFEVLFRSGAVRLFRRQGHGSVLVLIYHDILPPGFPAHNPLFGMTVSTTEFEWQLRYLRKHYAPITFQEFADWFFKGTTLPANPVLITFDDGHRNNLKFALPIMKAIGFSAVAFVVTGSIGTKALTWFEDAYYRLMFTTTPSWRSLDGEVLPLTTQTQRMTACGRFFTLCRSLRGEKQRAEVDSLRSQLAVDNLNGHFPGRFEFLSIDEMRVLQESGFEIGAHTISHPILSRLPSDMSKAEIRESKAQLQSSLATQVRAFAYPFGAPGLDFSQREHDYVRQSGFMMAFAGEGGFVNRSCDPFNLPRVGIGHMSRAQFAASVTGTTQTLKQLSGGRH